MFTPDHVRAATELVRVCRPGGTIALANWTPAGFVGRMFQTIATHVPVRSLMWPPGLWGTEEHLRQLLPACCGGPEGRAADVRLSLRFTGRAVRGRFGDYYGPLLVALDALDQSGREALYEDLHTLVAGHDPKPGPSVAVASEYLEAIVVVR